MQAIEIIAEVCGSGSPPYNPPVRTSAPLRGRRGSSPKSCNRCRRRKSASVDPDVGTIRVGSARIFWSIDPVTRRTCDVRVSTTDQPREAYTAENYSQRWTFVVGNFDVDWLVNPLFTPEAVFGEMAVTGFPSQREAIEAIREFSKIDACDWARAMLARVGGGRSA